MPAAGLYFVLFLLPSLFGAAYAFSDWDGLTHPRWVGFANFRRLLSESEGSAALEHTLLLAVGYVVCANAVGLALALGLHRTLKSRNFLRAVFFAPAAVSPLAVAYVWQFILQPDGPANALLKDVGLGSVTRAWLGDPATALWAVLLTMIWQFAGYHMVIYLAGLQTISRQLYEAATLDGAGPWRTFRYIVAPQLLPAFSISVALSLIGGLKVFDQVEALTGGGPGMATETLSTQVYQQAFVNSRFGYSAALGLVLAVIVGLLAAIQLRLMRERRG